MQDKKTTWIDYVARFGYAAKTVVYISLGILTLFAAMSYMSTDNLTQKDVFHEILQKPFGHILLTLVSIGLFSYALWRLIQAIKNTEGLDNAKFKDVLMRIFFVFSAMTYAAGGWLAFKVLRGSESQSSSQEKGSSETLAAELMGYSWGVWLVGLVGLLIITFAFVQFKHAYKGDFMEKFERWRMSAKEKSASCLAGQLGYAARGILYVLVGGFFIQAAYQHDSSEAGGLKEALAEIVDQPFGQWLLAIMAIGLIMFGIFCAFESVYRQTEAKN